MKGVIPMNQLTLTDMEYSNRKKKTKREEFLDAMDEIIPWSYWVDLIRPYYFNNKRGRRPIGIETMLRMYLMQYGSICQTKELKTPFMTVMQCARLCT
jgi:hypothetical protein